MLQDHTPQEYLLPDPEPWESTAEDLDLDGQFDRGKLDEFKTQIVDASLFTVPGGEDSTQYFSWVVPLSVNGLFPGETLITTDLTAYLQGPLGAAVAMVLPLVSTLRLVILFICTFWFLMRLRQLVS